MFDPKEFPLVILRHGQSRWNLENRFTGWTDVDLTEFGRAEAIQAANRLNKAKYRFDIAFTSVLQRAIETLAIVVEKMGLNSLPVQRTWLLNERHYGSLQGENKTTAAKHLGENLVMAWRRSYTGLPPGLDFNDPRHPRFDPLYREVPVEKLPASESLLDTERRVVPYWTTIIQPCLTAGLQVLIAAHGNSLRALVRYLEDIPPDEVPNLIIPTGGLYAYRIDSSGTPTERYEL